MHRLHLVPGTRDRVELVDAAHVVNIVIATHTVNKTIQGGSTSQPGTLMLRRLIPVCLCIKDLNSIGGTISAAASYALQDRMG